jgi:ketosteroid isomerase-like protein
MKKLSLLIIAIAAIGMIACNQPTPVATTDATGEQNKAVVDQYLTAVRSGDMKTASDLLADNFMAYGPSIKDSANRAQFIELWTKRWETDVVSISENRYGMEASTVDSTDWVYEWGRVTANFKDGKTAKFDFHGAFRMENGKIAMSAAFYNVADIMEQQGFQFVPPKTDEKAK